MNKFLKLFFIFTSVLSASLFFPLTAHAQNTPTFTEFPISDNYSISSISSGPDGNVWFIEQNQQVVNNTYIYSCKLGKITPSGALTEFPSDCVLGLTPGPDGNIWFYKSTLGIGKITPSGNVTMFPIPSDYSSIRGLTNGSDGNLWVTIENGSIGRITTSGIYLQRFMLNGENHPTGITSGSDGNIWFTEPSIHKIAKITPNGSITEYPISGSSWRITKGQNAIWFIETVTDGTGNNSYKIGKITTSGTLSEYPINSSATDITGGSDGNVWFTDYYDWNNGSNPINGIGRITPSGTVTGYSVSDKFNTYLITNGPDGNIWFGFSTANDIANSNIVRANLSGTTSTPTSTPTPTPTRIPPATPTPTQNGATYVAMGDSYSSGEGNYPWASDKNSQKCHRSYLAWPEDFYLQTIINKQTKFTNIACSGAKASDSLLSNHSYKGQQPQIPYMATLKPDLVTITIGGNDIGFLPTIAKCATSFAHIRTFCTHAINGSIANINNNFGNAAASYYVAIKKAAPKNARILVIGYPRVLPSIQNSVYNCDWLSDENRALMNKLDSQLNSSIASAAKRAGVEYVRTDDALNGHELCTKDSWVNPIFSFLIFGTGNNPTFASQGHPNSNGQNAIAQVVSSYFLNH